jgi:hypothetical protein
MRAEPSLPECSSAERGVRRRRCGVPRGTGTTNTPGAPLAVRAADVAGEFESLTAREAAARRRLRSAQCRRAGPGCRRSRLPNARRSSLPRGRTAPRRGSVGNDPARRARSRAALRPNRFSRQAQRDRVLGTAIRRRRLNRPQRASRTIAADEELHLEREPPRARTGELVPARQPTTVRLSCMGTRRTFTSA